MTDVFNFLQNVGEFQSLISTICLMYVHFSDANCSNSSAV